MSQNHYSKETGIANRSIEAFSWLLEQILIESGQTADRSQIRRAVREGTQSVSQSAGDQWWTALSESSQSVGLKTKVADLTVNQALDMARDGAMLCLKTESSEHPWIAISSTRRGKLHVLFPSIAPSEKWMKVGELKRLLLNEENSSLLRCVFFEPYPAVHDAHTPRQNPLSRLRDILRPEKSDIWLILIFAVFVGILTLATPIAVESLVNTVAFGTLMQPVIVLALMLFTFLGLQALMRTLQTFVAEIIQRRLFARVAADLAFRLPRAKTESLDSAYPPELVNRFFDVVTLQKVTSQLLLDGVSLVLNTLIGMAVLAFYHPWLLGFDIVLLASIAFVILVMGRGAVKSSILESKKKYRMAGWLQDLSRCPTAFKSNGGAEFALERTDQYIDDYLHARESHFRILLRQIMFALFLQAAASTALLGLGGWLVISGQLTLGQLVASELIVTVIVGSFAKFGKHMESYYDLLASVDKLGQLFDLPMERTDGLLTFGSEQPAAVNVHHLTYGFPGKKPVLNGVSFACEPGQRVALTGPSGSGKTILLDLLQGLRTPGLGHLLIDHTDPRDLRPDIARQSIALVSDVELFTGTVAENVHLERSGIALSDVHDVLELLELREPILTLSEGLDTPLLASGAPLSQTQCRLLMLARALVGQPRLLLIDGLLDGLPDDVLQNVLKLLVTPQFQCTVIIATGRSEVIEVCDSEVILGKPVTEKIEHH